MLSLNDHPGEGGLIFSSKDQKYHSKHKLESKEKDKIEREILHRTFTTLSGEIGSLMEMDPTNNYVPPTPPSRIYFNTRRKPCSRGFCGRSSKNSSLFYLL